MIVTLQHGPVRELRLDRPPANALSPHLIAALDCHSVPATIPAWYERAEAFLSEHR